MSRARPLLATVAGALLVLAVPVRAQQPPAAPDSVRELPAVEIVGTILPLAGTAVGSGVPALATVLDSAALARARARWLPDALAHEAGASLYDDLGSPAKRTLVLRGFAASPVAGLPQGLTVFVDGVPVNEPDAAQVNFDLLPMAHLRRVEVLRGAAALLGPNSLGGAVNLVTPLGEGAPHGALRVGTGSYGQVSAEGSAGGAAGAWRWFAGGTFDRETGWRQATGTRRGDLLVNVARTGDAGGVRLQLLVAEAWARTAGSLPESVYDVRPDSNLTANDFEDLDQVQAALTGWRRVGGGRLAGSAWVRRHRAERFNVNQIADPDVRAFVRSGTAGASGDWSAELPLLGGTLATRLGAGASGGAARVRIFAERVDPGQTTDVRSPGTRLDARAAASWRRGALTLAGGARYDVVRVPFRNLLDPARDTTSTYRRTSPTVGASLALPWGLVLHVSAARTFRAPALIELACADPESPCPLPFALGDDPPLAPVVAGTVEAGLAWHGGPASLEAAAYRARVRDEIWLVPYADEDEPEGSTIDGYFTNVPRTRRTGLELRGETRLPGGHVAWANAAWTRAEFASGGVELLSVREAEGAENEIEPGDRLPLVPVRTAAGGVRLRLASALELDLAARHVGPRWLRGDEANETRPLPSATLLDAALSLSLGPWRVQALAENLLDREWASFGTFNVNQGAGGRVERFLTPGMPRTLRVVVGREIGG